MDATYTDDPYATGQSERSLSTGTDEVSAHFAPPPGSPETPPESRVVPGRDAATTGAPQTAPSESQPPDIPHVSAVPLPPSIPGTTGLPTTTPAQGTPNVPAYAAESVEDLVREGVIHALRTMGLAYFEAMARTNPKLFARYAIALLPSYSTRSGGGGNANVILQVSNSIPRSPLDALPEGFQIG